MTDYVTRRNERDTDAAPSVTIDRVLQGAFVTAIAALLVLAGSFATVIGVFPGPQITRAYEGGRALYAKLSHYVNVYQSDLWLPERRQDKGVTVYDPALAANGVTLYTSGSEASAYLIDMQGHVLHSWHRPFSTVWTADAGGIDDPQPDSHIYFRQARLLDNGNLLALYEGAGDTPYGYGVVLLDPDSQVIWSYFGRAHHQLDIGPDGRIYVLTHEIVDDELYALGHLARPRLEDFLVVLSPAGEELKKIRLLTAFADSPYSQMIYTISSWAHSDPTHANAVEYIDEDEAAAFTFGEAGQIMLSFREQGAIVVIDPEDEQVLWAMRGSWLGQHDPDILANGNILLFDNFGNYETAGGRSRVIEVDPETTAIEWQYAGNADAPLVSNIRSDQQRLANGNTLITESDGGRIVEVTRDGEIAWEFLNPVRGGPEGDLIPIIAWAERLELSRLDPRLLSSHGPHGPSVMEMSL